MGKWLMILFVSYIVGWGLFVGVYRTGRMPLPAPGFLSALYEPLYLLSDWTPLQSPLEFYAATWVWLFK